MTNEQKIAAIKELSNGLSANELRDVSNGLDELADDTAAVECERHGHQFENDQCGKPEHRFCWHCHERETTIQARQAKADEAADGKSALPSESLGSGSSFFQRMFGK